MSLINEALKRAKQAQPANARALPSSLPLRPAEPAQPSTRGFGLVLPATLGTILIAAAFSYWLLKPAPQEPKSFAQPSRVAAASPAPVPAPASPLAVAQEPVATNVLAATSVVATTNASETKAVLPAPPPAPPPPRLQAILFNPARPSAIISGRTVFVGDQVAEFRVAAINLNSVVLVSGSQTNLLKLN